MRLTQLDPDQLKDTSRLIEVALAEKSPSKAEVVRQLAVLGLCSPKSTGTEKTFLKMLQAFSIPIGPKLAASLKIAPTAQASMQAVADAAPAAPSTPPAQTPQVLPLSPPEKVKLQMTGGISRISVGANGFVNVYATDGQSYAMTRRSDSKGAVFDTSNYNLIELTES